MKVTSLQITNLRSISSAAFRFQPGFNLIVGVNGVGKSSVLDALSVCLSASVKRANGLRMRPRNFASSDIRVGTGELNVECSLRIGSQEFRYLVHKPRETNAPQQDQTGMTRATSAFLGGRPEVTEGTGSEGRPLAVMFSTRRAVPSRRAPGKSMAVGGTGAAFGNAFANRELRLREIAAWMRVQDFLRFERASAATTLKVLEDTVQVFLEGYGGLRIDEGERELLIDRGDSTVAVMHMSDGERGTLALVLDLTRRLVQANPEMDNPVMQAEAVVLIDEIDLHLHPSWQRAIVHKLTTTFPRCQFIATTHSPQVIGEVKHDHIHIMTEEQVYSPTHSFGVDSSRVLNEIMDAPARTINTQELLTRVSREIDGGRYTEAQELLHEIIEVLGETDPEVIRVQTLLDFLEGLE